MKKIELLADISPEDDLRLQEKGIVAIDCEMAGLNPLRDPLYIIQLCDPDENIQIIKNRNWIDAVNLRRMFSNPRITKVFHFAIMDCAFLLTNLGIQVESPYCTKIASKIARTYSSSHSLSSIVEELFEIKLDKKLQTSFWGGYELNANQLDYISGDVTFLLRIKAKLDGIIDIKGVLPTGISYQNFNLDCQRMIPTLVQAWVNGWDIGKENPDLLFGR